MPDVNRLGTGTHIQAVIMPKSDWTKAECKAWLKSHDYHTDGLDETDGAYRWRQVDPQEDIFGYQTDGQNSEDGKPLKVVLGYPLSADRSVTFRGRVMGVDDVENGQIATIGVRSCDSVVSVTEPVVSADCSRMGINCGDVVLVRCDWGESHCLSRVVAVSLFDAVPDTAAEYNAKLANGTADHEPITRSAPIVSHKVTRDEGGKDRQLVTCVVYEPGRIDRGWGTTASKATVESWAHAFLISNIAMQGATITDEHWAKDEDGNWLLADPELGDVIVDGAPINRVKAPAVDAYVVESWIERFGGTLGGMEIAVGTWMVEIWIRDPAIWAKVLSGEYTGVSIEGWKHTGQPMEDSNG
jgi:hypothetical protein